MMTFYPLSLSQVGIDLIKEFEGFVPHYYVDKVGKGTIGYGNTQYKDGSKPKPGDVITEPDAEKLLKWAADMMASSASHAIRNPLNQNQQDSVISLIYNIGVGQFLKSSLLRQINKDLSDHDAIRKDFMMYNKGHVKGKLVAISDLTYRRNKEANLFLT